MFPTSSPDDSYAADLGNIVIDHFLFHPSLTKMCIFFLSLPPNNDTDCRGLN